MPDLESSRRCQKEQDVQALGSARENPQARFRPTSPSFGVVQPPLELITPLNTSAQTMYARQSEEPPSADHRRGAFLNL